MTVRQAVGGAAAHGSADLPGVEQLAHLRTCPSLPLLFSLLPVPPRPLLQLLPVPLLGRHDPAPVSFHNTMVAVLDLVPPILPTPPHRLPLEGLGESFILLKHNYLVFT